MISDDELRLVDERAYREKRAEIGGNNRWIPHLAGLRAVYNRGRADAGQVTSDGCVRISNERTN